MRTLIADSRSELIPLTRGKPDLRGDRIESSRLIPTHAGKTKREERGPLPGRAHPRSRGENTP